METGDVLIAGAGPAGLAVAACLRQRGIEPVVVESGSDVGTSWRGHYDCLRLHTVKAYSALPGLHFPREVSRYPSRGEVIAYLERYATHFNIRPRFHERLEHARPVSTERGGGAWEVRTSGQSYCVRHLVMATGLNREPVRPSWPGQELYRGHVMHSVEYRSGAAFAGQRALVVGMGNTGAEIALDLQKHGARVMISVRTPGNILPREFLGTPVHVTSLRTARLPVRVRDALGRFTSRMAFGDLSTWGLSTPPFGPATQVLEYGRVPVLDVGTIAYIRSGAIKVFPAIEAFTAAGVKFIDGRVRDADVVVLATGFQPRLDQLLDVPELLGNDGRPARDTCHAATPGRIHLVGYRNAPTGLLREIGRQAEHVAAAIEVSM